ncbi:DUF2240 family protein [Candidatus Woesearchaeota archaeon]|jgi:ssDNA-binding replication factor A large subunit|nr:DUF2240 family protein [Candidatus Woesearchaeota archaeon]
MFQLPYEKIVELIQEKSELSQAEVEMKIKEKLDQLSGLISKEGAAHIVANQLGVSIMDQSGGAIKLKNVLSGMKNVEAAGKVLGVYDIRDFEREGKPGKVGSFLIGDETGVLRVTCWHAKTEVMKDLSVGDIVSIKGAQARQNNGRIELHSNDRTEIIKNPEGVVIDVPTNMPSQDVTRKHISELTDNQFNVELLATIVQVFNPNFFEVCPNCKKRVRGSEDSFVCNEHGQVSPDFSYVMNCVLDDGTETIRTVFFRDQLLKLASKTHEEILQYKEVPDKMEELKNNLLGQLIKVDGRTKKNDMFDRVEFTARTVDPNPNPEEELKKYTKED